MANLRGGGHLVLLLYLGVFSERKRIGLGKKDGSGAAALSLSLSLLALEENGQSCSLGREFPAAAGAQPRVASSAVGLSLCW